VGTSSERRLKFLAEALPGASFTWIRGNVPTRLQRVRDGELRGEPLHGTVLAAAGLRRLGLDLSRLSVRAFDPHELLPAPAQGALLAECRTGDEGILEALRDFHDATTAACVALERAVLRGIGGGCQQPLGALAVKEGDIFHLRAAYAGPGGIRRGEASGAGPTVVETVLRGLGL
jgi:hydroxymethylbilane synthase